MIRDKTSWRKRLKSAFELKKWDCEQLPRLLTRSALRDMLFNDGNPKYNSKK